MISSIQLKNNLISRIKNSNDINFLRALQTIFDTSEQSLFESNNEQNKSIETSRIEIEKGDYIESYQALTDMQKWLQKQ